MNRIRSSTILGLCAASAMLCLAASGRAQSSPTPTLEHVLARAAGSVQRFWQQISSVTSIETITREKLDKKGRREFRETSAFDHFMTIGLKDTVLTVEESRLPRTPIAEKRPGLPLLTTSGFPILVLVFHPYQRLGFRECGRLTRQVRIDGLDDDELLMELFL